MIKDFDDLLKQEKKQKDAKMNQLLKEMDKYEKQEKQSSDFFKSQYSDLGGMIKQLDSEISMDKKSLNRMETLLEEVIKRQKAEE